MSRQPHNLVKRYSGSQTAAAVFILIFLLGSFHLTTIVRLIVQNCSEPTCKVQ